MVAAAVSAASISLSPSAGAGENTFLETFSVDPSSPQPFQSDHWDVQVHSRAPGTWQQLETVQAEHGADCSGPPATHPNNSYEGSVYLCKNHLMTALNASDYGAIYLTPDRMLDWSNGEAVFSVDVSTLRHSTRDWWDIWISPYNSNLAFPLDDWLPDAQGEPSQYIHIRMNGSVGSSTFGVEVNGTTFNEDDYWKPYESVLTPDAMRRDTFELRIGNGLISFGMPDYNLWWTKDTPISPGFTMGVVQIGHHSYNPTKDSSGVPGTWHWDNVSISPSVPFMIEHVSPRFVSSGQSVTTTAGDLRFTAICKVKIDGVAVSPRKPTAHPEHFNSYQVPVSAGTHAITFSPDDWYSGPCEAKGFSIWQQGAVATPTPSPTATPTSTSTPDPTPTQTPTPTPIPTPVVCRMAYETGDENGAWSVTGYNYGTVSNAQCVMP